MAKNTLQDRNFDGLVERFKTRVYGSFKGELRLALIKEDILQILPENGRRLKVLDAGGGLGQMSEWLAEQGHDVTLVDLSQEMLNEALSRSSQPLKTHCMSIQDFLNSCDDSFDLILCHAVLEWLIEPSAMVQLLASRLTKSGHLSLVFFNKNSLIMTQAIMGNWDRLQQVQEGAKKSKGLTPQYPIDPVECLDWWQSAGLELSTRRGLRVFNDYVRPDEAKRLQFTEALAIERQWGVREPWWQLARYIHFLGQSASNH